jgi:hypothetical protein
MVELAVDILEVGCLASSTGSVVDDLDLDFLLFEIDKRHVRIPLTGSRAQQKTKVVPAVKIT